MRLHRWRRELTEALIPASSPRAHPPLPGLADLDRDDFWTRFDTCAPLHLRLGMATAGLVLSALLPRLRGHRPSLGGLDPDTRDRLLAHAESTPVLCELVWIGKVVACFAYFDHPTVQAAMRGER